MLALASLALHHSLACMCCLSVILCIHLTAIQEHMYKTQGFKLWTLGIKNWDGLFCMKIESYLHCHVLYPEGIKINIPLHQTIHF